MHRGVGENLAHGSHGADPQPGVGGEDATLRRESHIDFQTAQTARLDRLDEEAVLRLAASLSRILVSHDKRTMPGALASFVAANDWRNLIAKIPF